MTRIIVSILLAAATWSASANSDLDKAVQLVGANRYTCGWNSMFKLKKFSGDSVSNAVYFTFFLPTRHSYEQIDCPDVLLHMFRQGRQEIFKFLSHVESIYLPARIATLIHYQTSFKPEDAAKVKQELERLGTKFDPPQIRIAGALSENSWDDEKMAARLTDALQAAKSSDTLNDQYTDALKDQNRNLLEESLRLQLELARFFRPLPKALAAVTLFNEQLLKIHPLWISSGDRLNLRHLLHLLGKGGLLAYSRGFTQFELAAILAQADEGQRLKSLKSFTDLNIHEYNRSYFQSPYLGQRGFNREMPSVFECKLLIGELARTSSQEMRDQVVKTFNALSCENEYQFAPAEFNLHTPLGEAQFSGREYRNIKDELMARTARCGETAFLRAALRLNTQAWSDFLNPARAALKAGCRENAEVLVAKGLETRTLMHDLKSGTSEEDRQLVRIMLKQMNGQIGAEDQAFIEKNFGKAATREARIIKRHSTEPGRELLINAAAQDGDDVINLQWNGIKVELNENALNPTQQKLVDSLRMAAAPDETVYPLLEAFLTIQAENRQLVRADLREFEKSINEFLRVRSADLSAALPDAKKHLDNVLERSGETDNYNMRATSVFDVVLNGRMQCASGTDYMLVHAARARGFSENGRHLVAIMKPGHVLPGLGDTTSIEGIESTVQGKGQVTVVKTDGVLPKNTRVILADDYLMSKVLSSAFKDSAAVMNALAARAETVLKLKQGKIDEEPTAPANAEGNARPAGDGLNSSIFGFGRVNVPEGNIPRANMDAVPGDADPARLAELGRPRPEPANPLSRFNEVVVAQPGQEQPAPEMILMRNQDPFDRFFREFHINTPALDPEGHLNATLRRELLNHLRTEDLAVNVSNAANQALRSYPAFRRAMLRAVKNSKVVLITVNAADGIPNDSREQQRLRDHLGLMPADHASGAPFVGLAGVEQDDLVTLCCAENRFLFKPRVVEEPSPPADDRYPHWFRDRDRRGRARPSSRLFITAGLASHPGHQAEHLFTIELEIRGSDVIWRQVIAPVLGLEIPKSEKEVEKTNPAVRY